jgi:hypothetical protein
MKKLIFIMLLSSISTVTFATHLMGGQISATYLSSDTTGSHYILDLDVYRDTIGISMSLSQTVDVYSLDTATLNYVLAFSQNIAFDTSSGGIMPSVSSVYGVEIYNFRDTITFLYNGSYMIKWSYCCRNGAIINMANPLNEDMTFLTYVNVDSSNPNSSPTFLTPPVAYLPVDTIWQYNPLPFDPDGDSLVWTISVPLSSGGPVPAVVGGYVSLSDTALYSHANGIFSLDAISGQISWSPKMVGNFVASFAIEEYRNGVLIGGISRDMQFIVIPDSINAMPQISNMQSLPSNNMGYPYIKVEAGINYQVSLLASDPDVNDVVSLYAYGEPFDLINSPSSFNYVSTGNGNEIEGTFSWIPDVTHVRTVPYFVVFRTSDNFFYYDETVQFEVALTTTLENVSESFTVDDLYPNPASNSFTLSLELEKSQKVVFNIYNILGVKISSESLNLSSGNHIFIKNIDLNNGHYFINIVDDFGLTICSKKLIVVK